MPVCDALAYTLLPHIYGFHHEMLGVANFRLTSMRKTSPEYFFYVYKSRKIYT